MNRESLRKIIFPPSPNFTMRGRGRGQPHVYKLQVFANKINFDSTFGTRCNFLIRDGVALLKLWKVPTGSIHFL